MNEHRDDAQRQDERCYGSCQQYDAVHTMKRLFAEQQTVEHVEHHDESRHLQVVYQKIKHFRFL